MRRIPATVLLPLLVVLCAIAGTDLRAQGGRSVPLGEGPWEYDTYEQGGTRIRVSVVTTGLTRPWSLAWLPNGDMLVTERGGRLRIVRSGVLDETPVAGVPEVVSGGLSGLMEVSLHPRFAENGFVYLTYTKRADYGPTTALARGRFDGRALTNVRDLFVGDSSGSGNSGGASRLAWGADGRLYMTMGGAGAVGDERAQDPMSHKGKILRFTDEGSVPPDNPFVRREGYRPEIYSLGHRNQIGLTVHPATGELWATEQGPQGGDEVNVIRPGRNYGWPIVTYGRNYDGTPAAKQPWREDLEPPVVFWVPSIATSGMTFYTGDAIPAWQGNLFVGAMIEGRIPGTGHLQRIVLNQNGEIRREALLRDLRQRIRDVRQGPDGLLYLLTDEDAGALLRIEPASGRE